jgi:nifR3 family TIM-barrel protein
VIYVKQLAGEKMKLKIGNVELEHNIVLAPMAGITNEAFRLICREYGAALVYSEMISDKGLLYKSGKTLDMIALNPKEHPVAIQIFGGEADSLVFAATFIDEFTDADIIDINMGCPVNKVVKGFGGSCLLKEPEKIYEIVSRIKEKVHKPVTVKVRAGWDHENINCDQVARLAEKAGADAITIHGRTRTDMYAGHVNLDYIKMVKDSVSIPVIGNGDIKTPEDAKKMFDETHVDGIMVGRGALGNPWIFRELINHFENGIGTVPVTAKDKLGVLMRHLDQLISIKGEKVAVAEMRSQAAWYFKNLPNTRIARQSINNIKTRSDLVKICSDYLNGNVIND